MLSCNQGISSSGLHFVVTFPSQHRHIMDSFLQTAKKGKSMCAEAIKALALDPIPVPEATEEFPISLPRMKKHYMTAVKIRVVGNRLGRTTLEQSCKLLLELVDFAARFKFKKRIRYNFSKKDILTSIGCHVSTIKTWSLSLGDKKNTDILGRLEEGAVAARSGDQEMADLLGMDDVPSMMLDTIKKPPGESTLRAYYARAKVISAAALKIGDVFLEKINTYTMLYVEWIATEAYGTKQLGTFISADDVCDAICHEVSEIKDMLEECEVPLRRWSMRKHGQIADEIEESLVEEDDDPNYQPPDEESEDSDSEDRPLADFKSRPSQAGKKRPGQKLVDVEKLALDTGKGKSKSSPATPSRKKPRKHLVDDEPEEEESQKEIAPQTKKRQHHAKRLCPVCGKEDGNLKRHLISHAKKGVIDEDQVEKLLSIASHKGKRRGPRRVSQKQTKKGLKLKWCPYDGCETVTHYLRSHLTHYHKMKPGGLLETHLRVAREYKGAQEVVAIQEMIRSRRSASKQPTSTTTTSNEASSTATAVSNPPEAPTPSPAAIADLCVPAPESSFQEDPESESGGEGQDSDPDYEHEEDFATYFEDATPANDRQKWLQGFYRYLNTPDCGRKRNKNRRQHASQVRKVLEDLDPRGSNINILSEDEGYIVWTDWVDPKMEELSSGTIRSYMGTYEMFLNYVTMERVRPGQVPDLPQDVMLILRATISKLKGWRKTVDLEMRPQRNRKRLDECDYRLTTQDVDAFRSSSAMVNACRLLEEAHQRNFTMPELCLIRDMLITDLTIQTGTRPGALANANMQDFQTMREAPVAKMRVMLIPDHKRGVAGPAPVTLSEDLHEKMKVYVTHILPQFCPSGNLDHLFVMSDGKPFIGGTIYRRISEMWRKSGVRLDLHVTATNIRKWIVTVCHQKKIEGLQIDENALRLAMCHSNKTAETFYLREDLTEVAARATMIIAQCTRGTTPPAPRLASSVTSDQSSTQCQAHLQPVTTLGETQPTAKSFQASSQPQSDPTPMTQREERDHVPTRSLSDKEKTVISEVFADMISSNVTVMLSEIRAGIRDAVPLRGLLLVTGMDRKVADRVRHCQSIVPRSLPEATLEKEERVQAWQEQSSTISLDTVSSSRQIWSAEDTATLEKRFKNVSKCPKKGELKTVMEESQELKDLVERNEFNRVYEKVKNIFKKRKKTA